MTTIPQPLDLSGADAAMQRAADQARRIAVQTGTPLAIWQDGHVTRIPATMPVLLQTPTQDQSGTR